MVFKILSFLCQCQRENVQSVEPSPLKEPTFNCPVCMGQLAEEMSTKCGHIFCKSCIKASIAAQGKCPTCRRKITMKDTHRVYLPATNWTRCVLVFHLFTHFLCLSFCFPNQFKYWFLWGMHGVWEGKNLGISNSWCFLLWTRKVQRGSFWKF